MKQSLVLITVDCLRADHVGFLGYSRPVTPFLDGLANESSIFTNAIVVGAPTYFSFPGIMASRYPLSLGRDVLGIAPSESTLATTLHQAGYQTAAFLAGNPYLSARFGYHEGFDQFRDFLEGIPRESPTWALTHSRFAQLNQRIEKFSRRFPWSSRAYDEWYFRYCQRIAARQNLTVDQLRQYPSADIIVDQARSWLSSIGDQPFFLWLHLMDPHAPYYPPHEALAAIGNKQMTARRMRWLNSFWNRSDIGPRRLQRCREEIISLYDAGIYWVDKQISRLVRSLQHFQRWSDTIFVVSADHGEEFLEHGACFHRPENLPEQLLRVPLLLRSPDAAASKINTPISLLHLAPTLLELLDLEIPASFQGRSRWSEIARGHLAPEPVISECGDGGTNPFRVNDRMLPRLLAVRDQQYKLLLRFKDKTEAMYDLEHDLGEQLPLPPNALKQQRIRLLQTARDHVQRARQKRDWDLALLARLRELSYSVRAKSIAPPSD